MHRILAVGEIHRLGYVKPQHSNEGLKGIALNANMSRFRLKQGDLLPDTYATIKIIRENFV
jgi:hypothetical protein